MERGFYFNFTNCKVGKYIMYFYLPIVRGLCPSVRHIPID